MMNGAQFLILAWRAYRRAVTNGKPQYVAVITHNVPQVAMFVAVGREAWKISNLAVEGWELIK